MIRILVADDDVSACRAIEYELRRPHREIVVTYDGNEALAAALATTPDLVISDVMMPRRDGWSLLDELRRRRETVLTPFIFTSALDSPRDRLRGLRLGAVDYVIKPFAVEELSMRVDRTLDEAGASRLQLEAVLSRGVAGSVAQLGIASLLHVLSVDHATGVVEVSAEGAAARILVRDGQVVRAAYLDGSSEGADAIYRLVTLHDGQFAFVESRVTGPDEIGLPVMELLLEGARRADEVERRHRHAAS
jgi:DNA-binding response OmpR family regulator